MLCLKAHGENALAACRTRLDSLSQMIRILQIFRTFVLALVASLAGLSQAGADTKVTVFAAASLGEVLREIAKVFEDEVTLSLAGSGTIARQVAAGAPADVVILADPIWMDWLKDQNLIMVESRHVPARNALTVIGPADAAPLAQFDIASLTANLGEDDRIALGDPLAVPAGRYAKAWLGSLGLWEALRPRLAPSDNVRAALAYVARAESPMGIVYRTDLRAASDQVTEIWTIPASQQPDIQYAAAAINARGLAFNDFLRSKPAQQIFANHGFLPPRTLE